MFVGPGEQVYEGMIVGENARPEDLDVNAVQREAADQRALLHFTGPGQALPARKPTLEEALEFVREDESVEVNTAFRPDAEGRAGAGGACPRQLDVSVPDFAPTLRPHKALMPNGHPSFEDLLEAAPDAMLGIDAAGVVAFANARAKAILGRDPIGDALGELPAALDISRSSMGDYELVVLRGADPRALRAVLDNTQAAIFLKDPDGRYLLVNRAFERCTAARGSCSASSTARSSRR